MTEAERASPVAEPMRQAPQKRGTSPVFELIETLTHLAREQMDAAREEPIGSVQRKERLRSASRLLEQIGVASKTLSPSERPFAYEPFPPLRADLLEIFEEELRAHEPDDPGWLDEIETRRQDLRRQVYRPEQTATNASAAKASEENVMDPSSGQLTKVSMNLSPATVTVLRDLAKRLGTTMTEVVRRGIGLQKFVADETANGGKLLVEDADGKMKRVLLP